MAAKKYGLKFRLEVILACTFDHFFYPSAPTIIVKASQPSEQESKGG